MGSKVTCFMLDPSEIAEEDLRRYVSSQQERCPLPFGYHNAVNKLGQVPWTDPNTEGRGADDFPHDDPRWPTACPCGYVFKPSDEWQHNIGRLYRKRGTEELFHLRDAPPGAMWHAPWYTDLGKGPDGLSLVVMLPDNHPWFIDGGAKGGGVWTRTGMVPKITARPSILTPRYHGFLTDGVLESC